MRRPFGHHLLLFIAAMLPLLTMAADEEVPLLVRKHTGTYACISEATGESCGSDHWTMLVLRDGNRILQNTSVRPDTGGLLAVTLQVDRDFRPLDAFASIYSGGKWLGSGHFSAEGASLHMSVSGPAGYFMHMLDMPEHYSLLLHPPAADGWHFVFYDRQRGGEQTHTVCSVGRAQRGLACALLDVRLRYIGTERLELAAGTFDTERYRFGEGTDIWLSGPDRIVVRHVFHAAGTRTELISLSTLTKAVKP